MSFVWRHKAIAKLLSDPMPGMLCQKVLSCNVGPEIIRRQMLSLILLSR
jgi:hypothetical protein